MTPRPRFDSNEIGDAERPIANARHEQPARVASPDERARLWPKAVAIYSGHRGYQERTDREIPLVVLEPRA